MSVSKLKTHTSLNQLNRSRGFEFKSRKFVVVVHYFISYLSPLTLHSFRNNSLVMAASTSNPPTFLESCQLLSSSLSRLSTSLKSPSPSSTANLTSQVHQLIKDSFRGEWVQRDAMEEGERWKFDTRRSIVERQLDELIQSAVSSHHPTLSLFMSC